jgi:hypothetical protein
MAVFKVTYTASDTCGNTWATDHVEYYEAASLAEVWERLDRPRLWSYTLPDGRCIARHRTPAGKGYGHWEPNPDFDWERDKAAAIHFDDVGFGGLIVEPITVKT